MQVNFPQGLSDLLLQNKSESKLYDSVSEFFKTKENREQYFAWKEKNSDLVLSNKKLQLIDHLANNENSSSVDKTIFLSKQKVSSFFNRSLEPSAQVRNLDKLLNSGVISEKEYINNIVPIYDSTNKIFTTTSFFYLTLARIAPSIEECFKKKVLFRDQTGFLGDVSDQDKKIYSRLSETQKKQIFEYFADNLLATCGDRTLKSKGMNLIFEELPKNVELKEETLKKLKPQANIFFKVNDKILNKLALIDNSILDGLEKSNLGKFNEKYSENKKLGSK